MPALSAWPFVLVILSQMAVGGFSVYTLSATRAFVTDESLWSKGQHEAVYFLELYLDTEAPRTLEAFHRAIAVPLAYRDGRRDLEMEPPDVPAARAALLRAGSPPQDLSRVLWSFRHFRGVPYLERAIARWKETDALILEIDRLAASIGSTRPIPNVPALRRRLQEIDADITPRAIAFSAALNDGARVLEWLLMVINLSLAGVLAALTIWRVGRFLSQRRQIEGALAWQASHDELTGLVNRRAFEERLEHMIKRPRTTPLAARALMFIDLDQFKIVNDTCGHAAGDALLRRICLPVQQAVGATGTVARLGGDEFAVFMPTTDMGRATALAETIRAAVETVDFVWNGQPFRVSASIGLVYDENALFSAEEMMRAADMACFLAKEKGRNRVQVHHDADQELIARVRDMNWVQRIHQALEEDRFCLHAQEIVPLAHPGEDDRLHVEVLVRMRDERGVLIPPSSFIPAAERFGLMALIERRVVHTAFRTLAQRKASIGAEPIGSCWINLSASTIGDEAFLDFLKGAFHDFKIDPRSICFEVTETSAILDLDAARRFIRDLRGLGCTFALDDFGTGMSSFTYLKELPVDFLKIDGGFVKNLLNDRTDRAMVEMITHVGHVMGKRIVAEFVETAALADALRDIGVDYGQGFGISHPKPFHAAFEAAAASRSPQARHERLSA